MSQRGRTRGGVTFRRYGVGSGARGGPCGARAPRLGDKTNFRNQPSADFMIVATKLDIPINETVGRTWNEAIVNMTSGIETDLDFYQALKQKLVEFGV